MTDEKSWISNAWTCKHVVCSGTENDGCILRRTACPQPDPLLHTADLAGEVQESTLWSVEGKAGGDAKKNAIWNGDWKSKQAVSAYFTWLMKCHSPSFLKVCFGTEEGMSLSLASLL